MAPVTSDLLDTTRDKLKMELAASITKTTTSTTTATDSAKCDEVKTKTIHKEPANTNGKLVASKVATKQAQEVAVEQKSNKIPLRLVNAHITCNICEGYLIDATTLVECLHSCKYILHTLPLTIVSILCVLHTFT